LRLCVFARDTEFSTNRGWCGVIYGPAGATPSGNVRFKVKNKTGTFQSIVVF
jgi:hypothetical protein